VVVAAPIADTALAGETSPTANVVKIAGRSGSGGEPDLVRSYLRDIGRVPLLSHEQEITLGRQVQDLMALEQIQQELSLRLDGNPPTNAQLAEAAGLSQAQLKKRFAAIWNYWI
jgi:RNA polymerase nonessential primary-like sigma factor